MKPASTSSSPSSPGAMSCPGLSSIEARSSRVGCAHPRQKRCCRGDDDPGGASWRWRAAPGRAPTAPRSEATCRGRDRPRARETAAPPARRRSPRGLRAPQERSATSPTACSRSRSVGTTSRTTPFGAACAAAATYSALAAGLRPDTTRDVRSSALRATAVLRTACRLSEVEVATQDARKGRTFSVTNVAPRGGRVRHSNRATQRSRGRPDLLDDGRGRVAGLDRNTDHPAASRFDDVAADDGVGGPVGAFDEHVGLERRNEGVGRLLVEDDHAIDAVERAQDLGPLELGGDRTVRPLVGTDRPIGVETNDQRVTEAARRREIPDMPGCSRSKTPLVKTTVRPCSRRAAIRLARFD